ncbi:SAM-dependent methyltransferase [Sphaerisporangium sp. NPDC088356]|uniref:SAM-dependent methyltransferase n=1 Tax=Sphaerisporangium sp. NPDC088356 TaxID=3154871 RepID=UPI003436F780
MMMKQQPLGGVPLTPQEMADLVNVPSPAGVYQCFLGDDKDATLAERALAAEILASNPAIGRIAWDNRRFLGRAVQYAVAEAGIRQILDIGSGLPTSDNVHRVAQQVDPSVVTVYVDNDRRVSSHGRALLADEQTTHFLRADLRMPGELLTRSMPTSTVRTAGWWCLSASTCSSGPTARTTAGGPGGTRRPQGARCSGTSLRSDRRALRTPSRSGGVNSVVRIRWPLSWLERRYEFIAVRYAPNRCAAGRPDRCATHSGPSGPHGQGVARGAARVPQRPRAVYQGLLSTAGLL